MENEKIYSVLTEILEEQKENTKLLLEVKALLKRIEEKPKDSEISNTVVGNYQMQQQLFNELKEIKVFLTSIPQNIRQEKRLLLFPENNAREYYSSILRWLLFIIIATYGYWIIKLFISLHFR